LIIGTQSALEPVSSFVELLHQQVEEDAGRRNLPYRLSISVGYSLCMSSSMQPKELTAAADRMLYEDKRLAHQKE